LIIPFPVPLATEVMVMKPTLLFAVHAQSLAVAVKLTLPVPAPEELNALVEPRVNPHETPA